MGNMFINKCDVSQWGAGCCSSILANIFLCMYEEKIMMNEDAKSYRYIGDTLVVKFNGTKENFDFNCYPDVFSLKPSSESDTYVNYLDINMLIKNENKSLWYKSLC